uniref:Differentially expressed in FDCP 8 homolog B-like n=1 Tax=Hirondellea gigas TaxID=1518452 RepID=A0A6A7FR86_9CRUS
MHNWCFEEKPVSRASYQLLRYCGKKPLLELGTLNPHLFVLLQELCEVKKLREDLMLMKQYLCSCRAAVESKLLRRLSSRPHFVDNPQLYSLQDLVDLNTGVLLPELEAVHQEYSNHIKHECKVCQGRGHICLNCKDTDVLFPFDQQAVQCSACYAVMHIQCYNLHRSCAKCVMQGREGETTIIGAMGQISTPVLGRTTKRRDGGSKTTAGAASGAATSATTVSAAVSSLGASATSTVTTTTVADTGGNSSFTTAVRNASSVANNKNRVLTDDSNNNNNNPFL